LDAVTYIVKTFFPEEKNPVEFARQNGIVSKSFSISKARGQDLIQVELIKMLSVTLDLVEKQ
jgi:hypothetical protein